MKNFFTILFLIIFMTSCGVEDNNTKIDTKDIKTINKDFIIGGKLNNYFNIYGNILNDNTKILVSHINGQVKSLNCKVGEKVFLDSVIAEITPDYADPRYKSNIIQIDSLNKQLLNLQSIKNSTLENFTNQKTQLSLQEDDLKAKLTTLENNLKILENQKGISNNDLSTKLISINEQIKNLEESKKLVLENKEKTLKDLRENLLNLKGQIYNTGNQALKFLDETFGISDDNKDKNNYYENYLGAKNSSLKSELIAEIQLLLDKTEGSFKKYNDEELSIGIDKLSDTLKKAGDVIKASIPSLGTLSQEVIDKMYKGSLTYSDGLLGYKMNFDKLKNAVDTTSLNFDTKIKELDMKLEELNLSKETLEKNTIKSTDLTYDSNINNLNSQINTIENSLKTIGEQEKSIKDTKNTSIKQLDSQITTLQDSISKTNILLSPEKLLAGVNGTVKSAMVDEGNAIMGGKPICIIVPNKNSIKLEIYSPNTLDIGMKFNYLQNGNVIGTGTIISEAPDRNLKTQNYTYEGKIDFKNLKAGDYLDIKIIMDTPSNEIWIPINYIYPKLDGYYVNLKNGEKISELKVKIGKMNNGEIQILSGLKNGDILAQ